ncbi:MAG: class I SAM-dependent methyltransferase [Spirochaetes bacterium]|nr:class I SAM-dependent methyltransferase [Spirochaetota bacterium]
MPKLILPPRSFITRTNPEDAIEFYYRPLIGKLYQKKTQDVLNMLPDKLGRVLEIGYGSGIIIPTLYSHLEEYYGIDLHNKIKEVRQFLKRMNMDKRNIHLSKRSILNPGFKRNLFDTVLSISVFEHLKPEYLNRAFLNIKKILKPGGILVSSFPTKNIFLETAFRLMRFDPDEHHPSSPGDILSGLQEHFTIERLEKFPSCLPMDLGLYVTARHRRKRS